MPAPPRTTATRYIRITERAHAMLRLHRQPNETLSDAIERLVAGRAQRWHVHASPEDEAVALPM